jgi:hypothetical protein
MKQKTTRHVPQRGMPNMLNRAQQLLKRVAMSLLGFIASVLVVLRFVLSLPLRLLTTANYDEIEPLLDYSDEDHEFHQLVRMGRMVYHNSPPTERFSAERDMVLMFKESTWRLPPSLTVDGVLTRALEFPRVHNSSKSNSISESEIRRRFPVEVPSVQLAVERYTGRESEAKQQIDALLGEAFHAAKGLVGLTLAKPRWFSNSILIVQITSFIVVLASLALAVAAVIGFVPFETTRFGNILIFVAGGYVILCLLAGTATTLRGFVSIEHGARLQPYVTSLAGLRKRVSLAVQELRWMRESTMQYLVQESVLPWLDSLWTTEEKDVSVESANRMSLPDEVVIVRAERELVQSHLPKPQMKKQTIVFLCHGSEDKESVRELSRRLRQAGIKTWLDEEALLPGQDWAREIRLALREATVVVVCLSSTSVSKRGFVHKEIRLALDIADELPEDRVFIIPVKLEECIVPERLQKWHWVDLWKEGGFERLLLSIRAQHP